MKASNSKFNDTRETKTDLLIDKIRDEDENCLEIMDDVLEDKESSDPPEQRKNTAREKRDEANEYESFAKVATKQGHAGGGLKSAQC